MMAAILPAGIGMPNPEPQRPDPNPQIRIVISPETAQEIERVVHRAIDADIVRQITRDVGDTIDAVLAELPRLGRIDLSRMDGLKDFSAWEGIQANVRAQDYKIEQTAHETKTVQIGATGAIDLRNVSGDISVVAGTGRDTTIDIVRKSRGKTEADAKLGLERVTASVEASSDRATIESHYPNDSHPPYSVSIAYTVTAPPGTRVTVSSMSGNVTVKGIKGDQSINIFSGSINITSSGRVVAKTLSGDATVTGTDTDGAVELTVISGGATLQQVKARQINATVTSGDVVANGLTGETITLSNISGTVDYTGTLTKGGRLDLRSQSGGVKCTFSGSTGFSFTGSTFSGQVKVDPAFGLQTTNTSRREVRGTVGDGSAVVVLRAFSGDVVLTKK
jgi:DUF4097 and DUF4098 domain-containing protein YvlB